MIYSNGGPPQVVVSVVGDYLNILANGAISLTVAHQDF